MSQQSTLIMAAGFLEDMSCFDAVPALPSVATIVPISVRTVSTSNVLETRNPLMASSSIVEMRRAVAKKCYSMDDIFDASVRKGNTRGVVSHKT